ncbi:MAG: helix-turn-helix domain-containing protein [Pseudomonadota bacterium]
MDARVEMDAKGRKRAIAPCEQPCAIERGMRVLGGKWTGSILWHLRDGPVRFNDLARMIGGVSKKVLTQKLTEMEAAGLVRREVLSKKPLAVSYRMTRFGSGALGALDQLKTWAEQADL